MIENANDKGQTEQNLEEKQENETVENKESENEIDAKESETCDDSSSVTDKTIQKNDITAGFKPTGFFSSLLSIAIDEVVILGVSAALLYISDFIMMFLGYYISQKLDMLFVIFLIVNLIYTAAMETSKFSGTLGKIVSNLKVYKLK